MSTDPIIITTNLTLAGTVIPVVEERWPACSKVTVTPPLISGLTSKRWRAETKIVVSPSDLCVIPILSVVDTDTPNTSITPGSGALWVFRDIDGRTSSYKVQVSLFERVGTTWVGKYTVSSSITLPSIPVSTGLVHYGSSVHLFIPTATGDAISCRRHLDNLVAAGATITKTNVQMGSLFPTSTVIDESVASQLDTFMADCASRGLQVVLTCGWATTPSYMSWMGGTDANPWPGPTHLVDVDTIVNTFLTRWAPYAMECAGNEPNAHEPEMSAARVVRVLSRVYTQAKITRPATKIWAPTMASCDAGFLEDMYTAGLAGKHDGITLHPYHVRYDRGVIPEVGDPHWTWEIGYEDKTDGGIGNNAGGIGNWLIAVHECYRVMSAHGEGNLPVIMTEGGWSDSYNHGVIGARLSSAQQASFLAYGIRQLALSRVPFLQTLITFHTYDIDPRPQTSWSRWGLTTSNGERKPAWTAWKDAVAAVKAGTG